MNDRNVARIRTALPQAWGAVVVFVLDRLGYIPDDASTDLLLLAAVPAAGALLYDLARLAERHGWTALARVLLGSLREPHYPPSEAQSP